jgi:hypothetical protein
MNIKLLATLNDADWLASVHTLSDYIEAGIVSATSNGDTIESLQLSEFGRSLFPVPMPSLPTAAA